MGKVTTSWFVWEVPVNACYPRIIINSNNNFLPFTLSKGVPVCTIKYKVILYIRLFTIWLLLISPSSSLTVTVPVPRSHNKPLPVFQICYVPGSLCLQACCFFCLEHSLKLFSLVNSYCFFWDSVQISLPPHSFL